MNQTRMVLDGLRRWHADQPGNGATAPWVYAEEVRIGTGFARWSSTDMFARAADQRIDAFAIHTWPSKGMVRVAYEVKATTSDLRRELSQPTKQDAAMAVSNELYLVASDSVTFVSKDIPDGWGIKRVDNAGTLRTVRRAPWRDTPEPPFSFMLSLARNLQGKVGR